jgi:hypothetical protein
MFRLGMLLHLPVCHVVCVVLDAAEDFVDFGREDVGVWRCGLERATGWKRGKEENNEG